MNNAYFDRGKNPNTPIADVAISKRPLFTVRTQLRLHSHQNFDENFNHKQFSANFCG